MIIVWGLQKTTTVKRVTLTIENRARFQQTSNKTLLESDFGKLEGVQEVLVDVEKRAVYLKVDSKGFDIEKAKALIS
jgi:hypothetical protein